MIEEGLFVAEDRAQYRQLSGQRSHRDLRAWQQGMSLAESCYRLTKTFPKEELFGLTTQIRNAAKALPANVAEGWGRDSDGEFDHFLSIASGSLRELETHLELAIRLGLGQPEALGQAFSQCDQLGSMLYRLKQAVQGRRTQTKQKRARQRDA